MSESPPTVHPAPGDSVSSMLDLLKEGIPSSQVPIDDVRTARGKTTVGRRAANFEPGYGPVSIASKTLRTVPRWAWFAAH